MLKWAMVAALAVRSNPERVERPPLISSGVTSSFDLVGVTIVVGVVVVIEISSFLSS